MAETLVIDALDITISPQAAKAAGYSGGLFYTRVINSSMAQRWVDAGMWFAPIFEYAAQESLGGAAKGTTDGQLLAQQLTSLGIPHGKLVTVNLADFAPTPLQLSSIRDYWNALRAEVSAWFVLPYGTGWLATAMDNPEWENAMDDNGYLGSTVVPHADIYQRIRPTKQIAGVALSAYDEDVVLVDLPWWGKAQVVTPQVVIPPPPQGQGFPPDAPLPDAIGGTLGAPIVAVRPTWGSLPSPLSGGGMYFLGADGGVMTRGNAKFYGSLGGIRLNQPACDLVVSNAGYTIYAEDGGEFVFGNGPHYGAI